jgi:hypothetical protein
MGKYKSYIFLGITLVILLLVGYCVAKSSKEKNEIQKIQINFVSDHAITKKDSGIPFEVQIFFKKFEISEISTNYEPDISFRRIDLNDCSFSIVPDSETIALSKMYLSKEKELFDDYIKDTLNTVYFYLVPLNSSIVDNIKTFDNASILRDHINSKLKEKSLFNKGKMLNKVTILLLSGYPKSVSQETLKNPEKTNNNLDNDGQPVAQPTPKTIKTPIAPVIDLNLRKNKNQISWNPELSKPGINLSLVIYRYEDGIATDPIDVSNLSSYVYEPGAEGNNLPSKITLIVQSNIKVKGKNFLDEVKFTCKAH